MKNNKENTIEGSVWFIMTLLLFIFVPKKRIREAIVIFIFKQSITWLFGLLVVEKGLIRYPKRLFFKKATKTSFSFEYFVYPSLCVLFNLYYPVKRNILFKSLYYLFYTFIITGFELFALKFTRLISYKGWKLSWTFSTIFFTFLLSHLFHDWFFKNGKINEEINQLPS
ncbi:CBO0543 family protein [Bacillus benzoevorans]|uniref:Uncharacterized protein n=1 Tax=Bacillus benzoevorans TaxID=1456 RepID=A0A7X0LU98_9BACI|nr:CBO0543 family protein [Bacillus benzoevorans]MBB6444220.1 hypothetical protein [Bacillus benzoevorans]